MSICANESAVGGPLLFLLQINQAGCVAYGHNYSVIQWTGTCRSRIVWLTTMHKTTSMIRITQYKGKKVVHDTTNLLGITELKKKTTTTIIFTLFNDFDILILWLFSPPKNPPWYYPRCHQRWFTISPTFLERYAHSPAISDCKLWL